MLYKFYVCLVILSSSDSLTPFRSACRWKDLNSAYQSFARLHSAFFGIPHMHSIVRLLGSRSLPWLIRALLDHLSNKVCLICLKLFPWMNFQDDRFLKTYFIGQAYREMIDIFSCLRMSLCNKLLAATIYAKHFATWSNILLLQSCLSAFILNTKLSAFEFS